MNKNQTGLLVLFICISFGAGYVPPLIFLKWLIFAIVFFLILKQFVKRRKSREANASKSLLVGLFISIIIAFVSVPVTDFAKAKHNAIVCPFTEIHKSEYLAQVGSNDSVNVLALTQQISTASSALTTISDSILYNKKYYCFSEIHSDPEGHHSKVLILAGVHGDEPAGVMAIPSLLRKLDSRFGVFGKTSVHILCLANPVGFALKSRENECGCNINRDYLNPTQIETKRIVKCIVDFQPDLIIDLHENNGNWETCVMANKLISDEVGKRICQYLGEKNIALAGSAFDTNLPFPGWLRRSFYREKINEMAGLHDLMWYGQTRNIPVLTLECDQSLPISRRIEICNLTIEKIITEFSVVHQ